MPDRTIGELTLEIKGRLDSETAFLDAQVLLADILDKPRAWIAAHPESAIGPAGLSAVMDALQRLETGTPLPYVLGHWEFYGLDFIVTPDVLIPRPETELLVETALAWLKSHPASRRAVDVGTGSGCIAMTLAKHIPDLHVTAVDISSAALAVARQNAEKHRVAGQMQFVQADLLSHLPVGVPFGDDNGPGVRETFDLLAANLPYIPTGTVQTLPIFGREPTLALDGGADGLSLVKRLLEAAPGQLSRPALVLLEIESSQGSAIQALAAQTFPQSTIRCQKDLAGHDRLGIIEIGR